MTCYFCHRQLASDAADNAEIRFGKGHDHKEKAHRECLELARKLIETLERNQAELARIRGAKAGGAA